MGVWNATIFGNDTSLDIKEEFFRRYNLGEEVEDIKNSLLLEAYDEDRFNVIFALAHCMWEVGQLDNKFLNEVKNIIDNEEDLKVNEELGADAKFITQRIKNLEKFLEKISIKKEKPKKRVAPPVEVESKYRNGAVMLFNYVDGMWGVVIAVDSEFYDKVTFYNYIQTDIKMKDKPTMSDVLKAHIIDPSFHSKEYNSFRDPIYYHYFVNLVSGYLKSIGTKRFEKYNDYAFEIIGYLADWGRCSSGIFHNFDYHRQKTAEEFKECVMRVLTKNYEENPDVRTKMTVAEIEKEFLTRL
ncbi:hypothetical protein F1B92_03035 [Campylobacter sp. FMV-PI01]|uniref:DUF4259 domain-containing protein n=1 Tax=Campylobacter portucalensis TaxID=2608384 RepID=A0A6L5WGP2_9BACT|nr:hypothetical protein [Campylobacter portucalensis]MSN96179.1 hypothetical protein [Campylobacter portucalensis]